METEGVVYIVACCTVGCDWRQDCATPLAARVAGRTHEETHDFHVTAVYPVGEPTVAA